MKQIALNAVYFGALLVNTTNAIAHPSPPRRQLAYSPGFTYVSPVSELSLELPSDLKASQREIVATLTGMTSLAPGIILSDRSTAVARGHTRTYLDSLLRASGLEAKRHAYGTGENVYATLPATEQGESVVVLGAHYDSVRQSPGANDNATGIALIYAVAGQLSQLSCRTKRLVVVFFDEEENGLVGSGHFARYLQSTGENVHTVHTVDQIGWDQDRDRAIEIELPTPELRAFYQGAARRAGIVAHVTRTDSSDHDSFRRLGFNAVGLTEEYVNGDTTPHYHQPTDTLATVNFSYLESTTNLVTAALTEILQAGCRP